MLLAAAAEKRRYTEEGFMVRVRQYENFMSLVLVYAISCQVDVVVVCCQPGE